MHGSVKIIADIANLENVLEFIQQKAVKILNKGVEMKKQANSEIHSAEYYRKSPCFVGVKYDIKFVVMLDIRTGDVIAEWVIAYNPKAGIVSVTMSHLLPLLDPDFIVKEKFGSNVFAAIMKSLTYETKRKKFQKPAAHHPAAGFLFI